MDSFHNLEKKLIYLKGIQTGIMQGTNPNVFKYKSQIDYEVSLLEKEIHKVQQKEVHKEDDKEKNHTKIFIKKAYEENKKIEINKKEEVANEIGEEKIKEDDNDENISKMKFLEVSKNINLLKDKVFQNNNLIKLLNRNKTYQNSLKVQNILKQNNQYQLQIQQNQQLYDLLNLKINNNALYQKLYQKNNNHINIQINHGKQNNVPKSILKTKSNENIIKKQVQMNIEKNEVKEIPVHENKKNLILQKKIVQHNKNNPIMNPKKEEIVNKIEESDEELMKEFQNTIGSLQKLLI